MTLRFVATLLLFVTVGLSSACTATADPPTPTPAPTDASKPVEAGRFPDMSGYTAVNPDDYVQQLDNPGRPNPLTKYAFSTPDGIQCSFGQPASASCGGNNLPGLPPAVCDAAQGIYRYNLVSTSQGVQQWPRGDSSCSDGSAPHQVLPAFHTLTVDGVTCGVDDKATTACNDPQGRGFVLSPTWSGWLPRV